MLEVKAQNLGLGLIIIRVVIRGMNQNKNSVVRAIPCSF